MTQNLTRCCLFPPSYYYFIISEKKGPFIFSITKRTLFYFSFFCALSHFYLSIILFCNFQQFHYFFSFLSRFFIFHFYYFYIPIFKFVRHFSRKHYCRRRHLDIVVTLFVRVTTHMYEYVTTTYHCRVPYITLRLNSSTLILPTFEY